VQEAYTTARAAVAGRTATDAYPNWVLAHTAAALGRQTEAIDALRRRSPPSEPVPLSLRGPDLRLRARANNIPVALQWTDQATKVFAGAPRFKPHKIRLLRKGRPHRRGQTLHRRLRPQRHHRAQKACEAANQTPPAARRHRDRTLSARSRQSNRRNRRPAAAREGVSCEATPEGSPRGVLLYVERLPRASTKQMALLAHAAPR
jgi:hypothetical protein